jgi:probable rRNA maturation factor
LSLDLSDVPEELRPAVAAALGRAGVRDGHLGLELVGEQRMSELNHEHRGIDRPTDVLSFPLDGTAGTPGPRELGDIVICPARTDDLREAAVHGALHLCDHDHETDDGEMLALQAEVMKTLEPMPE